MLTSTLFELDPGDQIAPNITCYFCTVAVDRTLQFSGMHVEKTRFCLRVATSEFGVYTQKYKINALLHNLRRSGT